MPYDKTGFGNEVLHYFYDTPINAKTAVATTTLVTVHLPNLGQIYPIRFGVLNTSANTGSTVKGVLGLYHSDGTLLASATVANSGTAIGVSDEDTCYTAKGYSAPDTFTEVDINAGEYLVIKQVTQGTDGTQNVCPWFTYKIKDVGNTTIQK